MLKFFLRIFIYYLFFITSVTFGHQAGRWGEIHFATSANQTAQEDFEKGVMLLHNFEYDEAREYFQKAKKSDPKFALAYWGEAMTYNHPLWGEQDLQAARNVLNELSLNENTRVNMANTLKEKGFMRAIHRLYGAGDKPSRDKAYADAMRDFYRQFPQDDEIASFYALALLGTTETNRDFKVYMQAAGITEEVINHNRSHPGALHYTIHSYDDPIHAPLGLRAARSYAKIAPDVSHALHMPSHIFMAMGLWDDVIQSNLAAWESGLKHNPSHNPLNFTIDDLHALQWLSYAYLQTHQYQLAYHAVKEMEYIAIKSNSAMAKWYYALMRAAYLDETHFYQTKLASLDLSGLELSAQASQFYVDALIFLNDKDIFSAKQNLIKLKKLINDNAKISGEQDYFTSISANGILAINIIVLELEANIAAAENQHEKALQLLSRATKLEEKNSFGYGPPIPIKPSYELLGDLLVRAEKYQEAYAAYRLTLNYFPHRAQAELGLKNAEAALKEMGKTIPTDSKPYFNKLMLPAFYH